MRSALPRVAFKQLGHRIRQEREEQASRLGKIEPSLEGASGGLPLTEGVPGARLQQESRDLPHLMGSRDGAVEDGRERGGQDGIGLRGLPSRAAAPARSLGDRAPPPVRRSGSSRLLPTAPGPNCDAPSPSAWPPRSAAWRRQQQRMSRTPARHRNHLRRVMAFPGRSSRLWS